MTLLNSMAVQSQICFLLVRTQDQVKKMQLMNHFYCLRPHENFLSFFFLLYFGQKDRETLPLPHLCETMQKKDQKREFQKLEEASTIGHLVECDTCHFLFGARDKKARQQNYMQKYATSIYEFVDIQRVLDHANCAQPVPCWGRCEGRGLG